MELIISIVAVSYVLIKVLRWHLNSIEDPMLQLVGMVICCSAGFWGGLFIFQEIPAWIGWPIFVLMLYCLYRLYKLKD